MQVALDTNALLRLVHRDDAAHPVVASAVLRLLADGHTLCCTSQNIVEFWSVSTRPASARGGFGLTQDQTSRRVDDLQPDLLILPDHDQSFAVWRDLVTRLDIRGTKVHDARIAATLFRHGVTHLLTWDGGDFKRFQFLTCLSPEEILKGPHGIA